MRCLPRITSRTSGCRATAGTRRSISAARMPVETSSPAISTRPSRLNVIGCSRARRASASPVLEIHCVSRSEPGERAVHGARCRGGRSRAGGRARAPPCSSPSLPGRRSPRSWRDSYACRAARGHRKKPGKLVSTASAPCSCDALARGNPCRRAEHRQPVIAAGVEAPPRRRAGTPRIRKPSGVARMCAPIRRSSSTTASIRSDSFTRSSAAPLTTVSPRAWHGGEGEQRQLVDERGNLGRGHGRADQLGRAHLDVTCRLPADRASVVDRDPRAHALEDVEQADPARVEAHPVDGHVGSRNGHRGDEQRRSRGEVSGDLHAARAKACRRLERRRSAVAAAPMLPLARAGARCDLAWAAARPRSSLLGIEACQEDGRLHLRRGHGKLVVDRLQRAAAFDHDAERGRRGSRHARPCAGAARRRAPSGDSTATRRRRARTGPPARRRDRPGAASAFPRSRSRSEPRARRGLAGRHRAPSGCRRRARRPRLREPGPRRSSTRCRPNGRIR